MNTQNLKFVITAVLGISLLVTVNASSLVLATTTEETGESDHNEATEYQLDTVTVTAQKQEENLQEVPASVTALTEGQIQDAGIEKTEDIAAYTPNLHIVDFGSVAYYTMRGLSNTSLSDPSVGVYVDGVPYSDTFAYNTSLIDVERIEVLRGPQGSLYGKNSQAGVINIITKKPTDNIWQGRTTWGFGNYDSANYLISLSGPLQADKLFLSMALNWAERDGFLDNNFLGTTMDEQKKFYGRASLRWLPTEDWDITLSMAADKSDNGGLAAVPSTQEDPYTVNLNYDGEIKSSSNNFALNMTHKTSKYLLTSITTARNWEMDPFRMDYDMTPYQGIEGFGIMDIQQFSQEIRWQSPEQRGKWQWLTGLYYENKQSDINEGEEYGSEIGSIYPKYSSYAGVIDRQLSELDDSSAAIFGQLTYALNDKTNITLGNRLQQDRRKMEHEHRYEMSGSVLDSYGAYSVSDTFTTMLPKVSLDYRLDQHKMFYVSIGKGYKSGGFSRAADSETEAYYDPEKSWNYEMGLKTSWLQNRLSANLAVFRIETDDYQVEHDVTMTSIEVLNAAKAINEGIELEINARPRQGLDLFLTAGIINAEFKNFTDPDDGTDYSGNTINMVPDYTYSLGAQYRMAGGMFTRAEWQLIGPMYWDEANTAHQDSYQLVNVKIGYEAASYEFYIYGKNLLDEEYYVGIIGMGSDAGFGKVGAPRTFGCMFTKRF